MKCHPPYRVVATADSPPAQIPVSIGEQPPAATFLAGVERNEASGPTRRGDDYSKARLLFTGLVAVVLVLGGRMNSWRAGDAGGSGDDGVFSDAGGEPFVDGKPLGYWLTLMTSDLEARSLILSRSRILAPLLADRFVAAVTNPASGEVTPRFPSTSRFQAISALIQMGASAASAVPALTSALATGDRQTSLLAAEALGSIGPASATAVPELMFHLKTARAHYQLAVVQALGRIGPAAHAATPALLEALQSDSEATVLAAARALWGIEHNRTLIETTVKQLAGTASEGMGPAVLALLSDMEAVRSRSLRLGAAF